MLRCRYTLYRHPTPLNSLVAAATKAAEKVINRIYERHNCPPFFHYYLYFLPLLVIFSIATVLSVSSL